MKTKDILIVFFMTLLFASCEQNLEIDLTTEEEETELEKRMTNTSWKLVRRYQTEGNTVEEFGSGHIGSVLYFSDEIFGSANGHTNTAAKALFVNGQKWAWWFAKETEVIVQWTRETAGLNGECSITFGPFPCIKELNASEMIIEMESGRGVMRWVYSRVDGGLDPTPGDGGDSSYEAPEVYYYDSTPGYTNLKVQFKIGNKSRTKVTSAVGYCNGKSANGNIGSSIITFNFSNLKRGTTYRVYCRVSGPGGTRDSDTVVLATLN